MEFLDKFSLSPQYKVHGNPPSGNSDYTYGKGGGRTWRSLKGAFCDCANVPKNMGSITSFFARAHYTFTSSLPRPWQQQFLRTENKPWRPNCFYPEEGADDSSETSALIYQNTRHHNLKESICVITAMKNMNWKFRYFSYTLYICYWHQHELHLLQTF